MIKFFRRRQLRKRCKDVFNVDFSDRTAKVIAISCLVVLVVFWIAFYIFVF